MKTIRYFTESVYGVKKKYFAHDKESQEMRELLNILAPSSTLTPQKESVILRLGYKMKEVLNPLIERG